MVKRYNSPQGTEASCSLFQTMKKILNGKVLAAALVIAGILLCSTVLYILVRRPAALTPDLTPASAIFTIIPAATSTPRPLPPTLTPIPATPTTSPTPAPGQIAIGVYVEPSTGGDGLRIHVAPSLSAELAFPNPAFDSEVFLVTKGPEEADGYTWWYLTASYDTSRAGWAVQDYLKAIPKP
jgi:hypothetical protein